MGRPPPASVETPPVFDACRKLWENMRVAMFSASIRMAGTAPHPRPTCARARSLLTARLVDLCTAFLPGARAYSSAASHVGPGPLASPPLGTLCASIAPIFNARKIRGAVLRMSTSVWCARCQPATAADRRERPRAASSAITPEPVREFGQLAEPATSVLRLDSSATIRMDALPRPRRPLGSTIAHAA
jgi:hypothetical protein